MTEFILWYIPLVVFMLSPALIPILIHTCGHLYDTIRPQPKSAQREAKT